MSTYREILLKKFNQEYQKLNEKQKEAVDTIEGPVMVIAGPGTGKTQILAARIGKILLDTDVLPAKYSVPHLYRCRRYCHAQKITAIYWSRCLQSKHLYVSWIL